MSAVSSCAAWPARRRVTAWLGALAVGAALAGCAAQAIDTPVEFQTASDETPQRKRARTRLQLASEYFEHGQYTVALDEQKKALMADPSYADAHNLGGLIYMALGDRQLAQAHFQRAIALNPRDANSMHNLGWMLCEEGRYPEATQWFQRAIAVPTYQDRAKTLMAQGVCEARSGDGVTAEATLKRSYELDAGNPETAYTLARLLYQRGDFNQAQFYIRRLNNSERANAESLWLGIKVERRLNNQVAMQQLGSQLRRRFPESRELLAYERGAFDD